MVKHGQIVTYDFHGSLQSLCRWLERTVQKGVLPPKYTDNITLGIFIEG